MSGRHVMPAPKRAIAAAWFITIGFAEVAVILCGVIW